MAQIGGSVIGTIPRIHMEPFSAHMDLWRPQISPIPCFRTSSQVSAPIGPCGFLLALWFPIGLIGLLSWILFFHMIALDAVDCSLLSSSDDASEWKDPTGAIAPQGAIGLLP